MNTNILAGKKSILGSVIAKYKELNINGWILFYLCVYLVLVAKIATFEALPERKIFGTYSLVVSFYILSRFAISYFHGHDHHLKYSKHFEPTITFGIPSKNEGENIRETILRIAEIHYPPEKFDILAINDGSTDNTLEEMLTAQKLAAEKGVTVRVINWEKNCGKREGMATCVRESDKEIVVFIDSDSFIEPRTPHELVKYFSDDRVAAVAGHAYVANADKNILTKMQSVRYFVAFRAYKGTESVFDSVTCCSGCCSAYRRSYLVPILDEWLNQTFLGVRCTYGDDRSLTNFLLVRGYKALYSPQAIAHTFVPDTLRKFMKQQLRWKKSWIRESLIAAKFMWKKPILMSIGFYLGVILPLLAPLVVFHALIWYPVRTGSLPWFYLFGLILMSFIYGLYYYIHVNDKKWVYGAVFAVFYTLILVWQLPYAILSLRDAKWGTR